MAAHLSLVLCLGAVLVAAPPAAASSSLWSESRIVLPDCRPQVNALLEGQVLVKEQLDAVQRSLAAIQSALEGNQPLGDCPDGWTASGESCFLLNGEALQASEALEACRRWNPDARLACLHEGEHLEVVHGLVNDSPYQQAWIGLRRVSGGWQWSDGAELAEGGPWLPYQPDNNGGEDCVMYDRTERYPGWTQGWSDERCVLTAASVCELSRRQCPDHH